MRQPIKSKSNPRLWAVRFGLLLLGVAMGLILAEFGLRIWAARISQRDKMSPGLVRPDAALGWRCSPGWSGEHQSSDFEATYQIDSHGFRADRAISPDFLGKKVFVVGDSFTFGLGVNDDETFAHFMTERRRPKAAYINAAVPGYSTDQEALLIENELLRLQPDEIILVVYLGNDLLDNPRAVPLQVRGPKPFFELRDGGLELKNSPVAVGAPHIPPPSADLLKAVMGADIYERSWRRRMEQKSEVFRMASHYCVPEADHQAEFELQLGPLVRLFDALLERIRLNCHRSGVKLSVVLLPGRSYVVEPKSLSAQYQEFLRKKIRPASEQQGLKTIDLGGHLRTLPLRQKLFFPNDGHLTVQGHQAVAEKLVRELSE